MQSEDAGFEKEMIVLHIGLGKTGSTSLQEFLRRNRSALTKRGIEFPDIKGISSNGNVTPAALALVNSVPRWVFGLDPSYRTSNAIFEHFWREILAACTDPNGTILLSSEEFDAADPHQLRKKTDFDGHTKKIVVFLRRQDRIIESAYVQDLQYGYTHNSLESYVDNILKGHSNVYHIYRYDDLLQRWIDAFGHANVIPIVYKRTDEAYIYRAFLDTLAIPMDPSFTLPPARNQTAVHPWTLAYLRLFNRSQVANLLSDKTLDAHRSVLSKVQASFSTTAKRTVLPTKLRKMILSAFQEQNRLAAKRIRCENPDLFDMRDISNLHLY